MSGRASSGPAGVSGQALERASQDMLKRVPPHDLDAEQSVLGSVFVRQDVLDKLGETLRVGDFYSPLHQDIFTAFQALSTRRQPVDLVTVADELTRMGKLDAVGGSLYLAQLASATVSAGNSIHHAKIIRAKARRRGMLALSTSLVDLGFDEAADPGQFAAIARQVIEDVLDDRLDSSGQMMADILDGFFEHLAKLKDGAAFYVPTPIHKLNGLVVGLGPGEVTIVAGRPGNGKTAFALNCLIHAATKGHPSGIASLEMNKLLLCGRLFSDKANVNAQHFRDGNFTDDDWQALYGYANEVNSLPLLIDDKPKRKPSELRVMFRRWKRDHGLRFAVVDYLQFVSPENRSSKREQEVSEISRELKAIAKELDIALMVLCQLSREAEKDKKFLLSHLRESGSIEQDADIVMGFNPWKSSEDVVPVKLVVAKSRNSRVGEVDLFYRRKFSRFEETE